ncbi:MAG: tetratricopeptide repeat protein [Candidatus Riflebacteria bacterium]|nr:tetratricopeptide repeat protein [Candidatus Riflebacteria bacterium]
MKDSNEELEKIQELFSQGKYMDVQPLLKDYLSKYQDNQLAYKLYGNVLAYNGYLNKARLVWRYALKKFPENTDILYNLALSGVVSGKKSKIYLKKLLDITPDDTEAISMLAQIAKDEGNYKLAIKYWKHSLEIQPDKVETMNNIGVSYAILTNYGQACVWYKKALEIDSDYALAHFNLATALYEIGELKESLENAEKAMELDPTTHAPQALSLIRQIKKRLDIKN